MNITENEEIIRGSAFEAGARSLGARDTGGRIALPVFIEILLRAYSEKLAGLVPRFPAGMEQRIDLT